jgi:uncharacterized damage-inducible protein DinB
MSTVSWFMDMARNNAWSNQRLYRACEALDHAELTARRTSFFPSILSTLAHIAIVDEYYLDGLEQAGRGRAIFDDEARLRTFDVVRTAQRTVDARLIAFTRGLADDAALIRTIGLERRDGVQHDRVGDVLLHLVFHQVHHRGQVHAMLSGTRVPPPQLDEYFLAGERPLAEKELEQADFPR